MCPRNVLFQSIEIFVSQFHEMSVFMPTYFTNAVLVVFASGNAADNFFTKKWMIKGFLPLFISVDMFIKAFLMTYFLSNRLTRKNFTQQDHL